MIHEYGKKIRSPGGSFVYEVQGPVCRLYDREELPWPCCSLQWRGKQPSWRRIGRRFIADIAARRCPSYAVRGVDSAGTQWEGVVTLYMHRLNKEDFSKLTFRYHSSSNSLIRFQLLKNQMQRCNQYLPSTIDH